MNWKPEKTKGNEVKNRNKNKINKVKKVNKSENRYMKINE